MKKRREIPNIEEGKWEGSICKVDSKGRVYLKAGVIKALGVKKGGSLLFAPAEENVNIAPGTVIVKRFDIKKVVESLK